jgi:NAD(P)H dehydrogenase (quinone)
MKIGITGAAGQLGKLLLQHAQARIPASDLIAITRDPSKLESFSKQGVQVRAADFTQPAGLPAAFHGIERLLIIPTSDLQPGARKRQHASAIQAAVAAGVKHVLYVSTVGSHPDPHNELFDSHFATDMALMTAGVPWTILRMSVYMETLLDNAKRAVASGTYSAVPGAPAAYVLRDDIAAAAAGILATSGHEGMTYHATGPVSVTQAEIADAIAQASGKPIRFVEMTEAQQRAGLEAAGLPPALVNLFAGFQATLRKGAFDLVTNDVARLAGRPAQSPLAFFKMGAFFTMGTA